MIWIGVDDTDVPGSRGTGHLTRELAAWLGERFTLFGVTRHQLLRDPRVPMTANNSSAAIHLQTTGPVDLEALAAEIGPRVRESSPVGSDPGLCVAQEVAAEVTAFGQRAKTALVTQAEARALATQAGLILHGLGGDEGGVIGALAAVGLAASGNDGRFVLFGQLRELTGVQPVEALLAAGAYRVQALSGETVADGLVDTQGKLRPSLVAGRPVLWVERRDGQWVAVKRD